VLYLVTMEVRIPHDADEQVVERLKAEEKQRAQELQRAGEWRHLWRVVGRYANVSVFDVDSHARLHEILSTLPLFPYLDIAVTPLTIHPSALERSEVQRVLGQEVLE
jgi:muconolactone D-isomerase